MTQSIQEMVMSGSLGEERRGRQAGEGTWGGNVGDGAHGGNASRGPDRESVTIRAPITRRDGPCRQRNAERPKTARRRLKSGSPPSTFLESRHSTDDADGVIPPPYAVSTVPRMPLDTTSRLLTPFLDRLSDEELDAIPYGVVQLNASGLVLSYNRAEADNAGSIPRPIGRNFFLEVYSSANVPELWNRFRQAVMDRRFDETFQYTFSCGPVPRPVLVRMYYSVRTKSVWLFVAKPDGSPLDRVVPTTDFIVPTPLHGVDLRTPRVA